jgi:hypothetical protein
MCKINQQFWAAAGFVMMLGACAPAMPQEDFGFAQPAPSTDSEIVVRNENVTEMDIYAVVGSLRSRIGSVEALQTARLRLPRVLLARPEIMLQADPVGPDEAFTFPAISIRQGIAVEMLVAPVLRSSGYTCLAHCR